jgi:hypothetical protein
LAVATCTRPVLFGRAVRQRRIPLDPANPAAVLGSAGLDRSGAVVFVHPAEARRTLRRSPMGQLEQYWFAIKWCRGSGTGLTGMAVWLS